MTPIPSLCKPDEEKQEFSLVFARICNKVTNLPGSSAEENEQRILLLESLERVFLGLSYQKNNIKKDPQSYTMVILESSYKTKKCQLGNKFRMGIGYKPRSQFHLLKFQNLILRYLIYWVFHVFCQKIPTFQVQFYQEAFLQVF